MMEGITILHQYEAGGPEILLGIMCWLLVAVSFFGFCYMIYDHIKNHNKTSILAYFLMLGLAVLFSLRGYVAFTMPHHNEYKVLLDETVPYVEFTERYEVLRQEGDIYTIKEIVN